MNTCGTCRYRGLMHSFVPSPEVGADPTPVVVNVCRCEPPKAVLVAIPGGQQVLTLWPQIDTASDVCGRYDRESLSDSAS